MCGYIFCRFRVGMLPPLFSRLHHSNPPPPEETNNCYPFISGQFQMPFRKRGRHLDLASQSQSGVSTYVYPPSPPRPTHSPSPPPNSPVPQCCDTSTRQRRLPDNPYQKRFGGLLIRPLSKSFLSMEGNVTPILKAGVREGRRERRAGGR